MNEENKNKFTTDYIDQNDIQTVSEKEKSFLYKASVFFLELIKIALLAGITIGLVRYFLFKPFYVKGQSKEGGWGEGIFARPRFRRFFFRRRNFSYFALRNAPPELKLCLPCPPVRTQ